MNTRQLLALLVATRGRPQPVPVPARLPELRTLQRRVLAARLGGNSRPVQAARALFDDVQ